MFRNYTAMPRDLDCMNQLRSAVIKRFDQLIKEHGQHKTYAEIYQMVATSPAPSFFLSLTEAKRIVYAYCNRGFKERSRALVRMRDEAFIAGYCKVMIENPSKDKMWAVQKALELPAPRFYIGGLMICNIVNKRRKQKK